MTTIDEAFQIIKRVNFLPGRLREHSLQDTPLQIGFGQTSSQPSTVRQMLEWLDVTPGQRVLDVGSGSGWTSALLATLVGESGRVHAVERIPELLAFGRANCERLGLKNISFHLAEEEFGLPSEAPYDRILVSAAADSLPDSLVVQLKFNGKLVIPVKKDVLEITKLPDSTLDIVTHPGFDFVPLKEKEV
jgi:protein-L-isoaspartate(D-aspartate) O-methyltransferase